MRRNVAYENDDLFQFTIMASESSQGRYKHLVPDWELDVETVLVRRNWDEATKGTHEPRPLVTPLYTSSTYVLESAKEGEVLSGTQAKVICVHIQRYSPVFHTGTPFVIKASCIMHRSILLPLFSQDGYIYSRWGNPTADGACNVLSKLEGAAGTLLFPSGLSAINTALFCFLKAGDNLVCAVIFSKTTYLS